MVGMVGMPSPAYICDVFPHPSRDGGERHADHANHAIGPSWGKVLRSIAAG